MNIFNRISLRFKISNKFRPYLNNKEKYMDNFFGKVSSLDSDIVSLYQQIKKPGLNKYLKDKIRYEKCVEKINSHNENVDFVLQTVES